MKKYLLGTLILLQFSGLAYANTILAEENNFPAKNHFGIYSILQASFYTRSYGPNGQITNASGSDYQLNQEFYIGLQDQLLLRLVVPYYFSSTSSNQMASTSGLFDLGVKLQYLIRPEQNTSPSTSILLAGRFPNQNNQQGIGLPYGRLGVMGVFEKMLGKFNTHLNLGYVYTFPYTDTTVVPQSQIDPGDTFQLNLAFEYPLQSLLDLSYEIIFQYDANDIINGVVSAGSEETALSHFLGLTRSLGGNSYIFGGVQVPLYIKKSSGLSAVVPSLGIYYEF